ncbi:hypothetical protein CEXT_318421 [Caerostris extrusa]|uniref:Uncharacterized protein n=1 Tax=Caerostris extrusa TaxID=172846 RepID=A0AAV4MWV3_CAEEX|nr:hypothetical protein CEXT_318421 [Caerostris extrusa]
MEQSSGGIKNSKGGCLLSQTIVFCPEGRMHASLKFLNLVEQCVPKLSVDQCPTRTDSEKSNLKFFFLQRMRSLLSSAVLIVLRSTRRKCRKVVINRNSHPGGIKNSKSGVYCPKPSFLPEGRMHASLKFLNLAEQCVPKRCVDQCPIRMDSEKSNLKFFSATDEEYISANCA